MSKNTIRRPVAVLLALLVVCSFGGVPAVAAADGGSSVGDDMSGVLGSDGGSDGGSTGDSAGSDGSDSGSDSDSDSGSGSGSDSDSAEGSGSDDGSDPAGESDSDSDGGEDVEAIEDTAMTVEANAVEATGTLNVTLGTTDGTVQETTYEALAAVDDTAPVAGQSFDGTTLEFDDRSEQLWARQIAARQTTRDDDSYDTGYDMGTDTTAMLGAAGATRAAGGQDGQSLPDGAVGGTALGLGALAAAVIRSTPLVAGAGTSAASSYLSTLLDRFKPFVFPLRYSRYDDSDPLEHDAREQVYGIVSETPGSYLSKVSERADLPLSTTRHHMKVLEREGLVSGAKLRGKRRFYPAYAEGIELAAALNDESTASIIDALARLGAASVSDLAKDLGRDPSTISHHLQRLEEDDIVAREREGRAVMNKLSPEARTALDPEQTPKPEETAEAVAD